MLVVSRQAGLVSPPAFHPTLVPALGMAGDSAMTSKEVEEEEEHEEGEISDEEPSPPSSSEEDPLAQASRVEEEDKPVDTAKLPASNRDTPSLKRRASLDVRIELGSSSELRAPVITTVGKRTDFYRGRGDLESDADEEINSCVLKRNGWGNSGSNTNDDKQQAWPLQQKQPLREFSPTNGVYGASLYNFAWAQAVSGRPSFPHPAAGDSLSMESSPKLSGDGLLPSGSPGMGSWPQENRQSSRELSRDSEMCRKSARSSEERDEDDMSPLRDNGGSRGERGSIERLDSGRGRRYREVWAERSPQIMRSKVEKSDRGGTDDEDHPVQLEESRKRNQPSESCSPNGRDDEGENGSRSWSELTSTFQKDEKDGEIEEREEGELEEGEIELPPTESPASPSKVPPDPNRPSKYNGNKTVDYWSKDKTYTRSLSKSQTRSQLDDYSSRRYRPPKPQESLREKRLFIAGDLVKNVTVKDAQKSFVDVCLRLQKALKGLDELRTERPSGQQDTRLESPPREVTVLARQAFAGIRAVYAVRNTASGREQERDKDIFPRLLGLASGECQKLFTPKQRRELDVMMQTIATAGRLVRDESEKGQYPGEQVQSVNKKPKDKDLKQGDSLGNNTGSLKVPTNSELKSTSDNGVVGRIYGFVDPKQAEDAAAIAAAALAYAQSSASARASSLYGNTHDHRSNGVSVANNGPWAWTSDNPSQAVLTGPGLNALQPNAAFNIVSGKYQPWSASEHRSMISGQDGYPVNSAEARAYGTPATCSIPPDISKVELISPPGYSKTANAYGMLEDDWEELSPPGGGLSSYALPSGTSVQTNGVKEDSLGGKVWSLRQEMSLVHRYKVRSSSTPSLYTMERLAVSSQTVNGVAISAYSGDQLPSPTHPNSQVSSLQYAEQLPSPTHPNGRGPPTAYSVERLPSPSHQKNRVSGPVYSMERLPSPTHQKARAPPPQYPAEQLPILSHPKSRGSAPVYAVERLPSPTPEEAEDLTEAQVEAKSVLPDAESKRLELFQSPGAGNVTASTFPTTANQALIRSQNLESSVLQMDQKIDSESPADIEMQPPVAQSLDNAENAKVTLTSNGILKSRDPRRRFQNHSFNLTDMVGVDLNSHLVSLPNGNLGDVQAPTLNRNKNMVDIQTSGTDKNRKRFALDADDVQVIEVQKRLKSQSGRSVVTSELFIDDLHAPSGTGGWLDDNVVLPPVPADEFPIAMEVDEEGGSTRLDLTTESQTDIFREQLNSVASSNKQILDLEQQTAEGSQRRMKPRDPRRALIGGRNRCESSSIDLPVIVTAASSTESVASVRAIAESNQWSISENVQTSKQGIVLPNIAPHFMEKLTSLVGIVGSTPTSGIPSQSQHLLPGGSIGVSGAVAPKSSFGPVSEHVEGIHSSVVIATATSQPQGLPEHQKDKSTNVGPGTRKQKGNPSQWGASQLHPGLEQLLEEFSEEERRSVHMERKRRMEEQDRMFSAGKLCLVLDLDHTLLNSAKFSEIEPEWEQRLRVAESTERNRTGRDGLERRELYRFPHMSMWTKLRPGIWKFLARASQLYELHVYTMGNKVYATEMAKLLDPTGKLFAGRVISKGDDGDGDDLLPKSKDLDGVLGMESAVVIIDDSARVWPHHSHNLIVVERYMYFPCSRRQFGLAGPSLLEVGHDERETDGMLASALGVIDRIHQRFFQNQCLSQVDVREILAEQQRQVLAGCKVVFSRVFPVGEAEPHRHPLWRSAEQFGAICTIAIDDQVTHVVAISLGTDKVNWALETGRYVVRPAWLEASTILYRRANERDFPVLPQ